MRRTRTIDDYNKRIEALKVRKSAAIEKMRGMIGEMFLSFFPDIPTDRKGCRDYLSAVRTVVDAHRDEFMALYKDEPVTGASDAQAGDPETDEDEDGE